MATHARQVEASEAAFAALRDFAKVEMLQKIGSLEDPVLQSAEMSLFAGEVREAEAILLQNNLLFRCIMIHISLFNWERALEMALKYKKHADIVVAYRQRFLKQCQKPEHIQKFIKLNEHVRW